MDALMHGVRRLTRLGLWFGGALVLAAAVLIGIDVVHAQVLRARPSAARTSSRAMRSRSAPRGDSVRR